VTLLRNPAVDRHRINQEGEVVPAEGTTTIPIPQAEAAELEARLDLVLALLESRGVEAHFATEPGDASGKEPDEGYDHVAG